MDLKNKYLTDIENYLNGFSDKSSFNVPLIIFDLLKQYRECVKQAETTQNANNSDIDKLKIAMVGAFSSGKSSFLNALLNKNLTEVGITQTTRCLTNITYGEISQIKDINTNKTYSESEYKSLSKTGSDNNIVQRYLIAIPDNRLEGMVLIDSPGFEPPIDGDKDKNLEDVAISEKAAMDADVVFFLLDIGDGTLKEKILEYLRKLNTRTEENSDNPLKIYVILNQADKKPESKRQEILNDVSNICKSNGINVEKFLIHTSVLINNKSEKFVNFYNDCQIKMWEILKNLQNEKTAILENRKQRRKDEQKFLLNEIKNSLNIFIQSQEEYIKDSIKIETDDAKTEAKVILKNFVEFLSDITLNFARTTLYDYVSKTDVEGTGFLGFRKTWEIRITENTKRILPNDNTKTHLSSLISDNLSDKIFINKDNLVNDIISLIDSYILSVFEESYYHKETQTYRYKRLGHYCSIVGENNANEELDNLRSEYIYALNKNFYNYFYEKLSDKMLINLTGTVLAKSEDYGKLKDDLDNCNELRNNLDKLINLENPMAKVGALTGGIFSNETLSFKKIVVGIFIISIIVIILLYTGIISI